MTHARPKDMRLRRWTPASFTAKPVFETLREVTATVAPEAVAGVRAHQLLRAATLHCQRGTPALTGTQCLACARIVMIRPAPDHHTVTVRCLWTEQDRVRQLMTAIDAVVTVAPDVRCGDADAIAEREGVHFLVVTDGDQVLGTICRCALAGPDRAGAPVEAHLEPHLWAVPSDTMLGQVAEIMEQHGASILAVVDDGVLRGVVTRSDLGLSEHGVQFAWEACPCVDGSPAPSSA